MCKLSPILCAILRNRHVIWLNLGLSHNWGRAYRKHEGALIGGLPVELGQWAEPILLLEAPRYYYLHFDKPTCTEMWSVINMHILYWLLVAKGLSIRYWCSCLDKGFKFTTKTVLIKLFDISSGFFDIQKFKILTEFWRFLHFVIDFRDFHTIGGALSETWVR